MPDLERIVKAYDIRGVVPDELDEDLARRIGAAFVELTGASEIVVAHDMRPSSPVLAAALADGATGRGADVVAAELASTDLLYFASGTLGLPGAMVTASHNPARYNGVKLCRAGAAPIGQDTGLRELRGLVERGLPPPTRTRGELRRSDLLPRYVEYLRELVDVSGIRPLRVAADAANGMAGLTVPAVLAGLPVELVPLYFELDGTFPNHEANPLEPANLRDLQAAVQRTAADVGFAFDGDADRCFVVDERGEPVSPSTLTALIATRELAREPGATVLHSLITSRAVPEIVREHGGRPERTRVGHTFVKARMAETGAVFAGEHSGHYYFRDFFRADSGMLAALHTLAALGEQPRPLSALLAAFRRYVASGEINSSVPDHRDRAAAVAAVFAGRPGVGTDELDGLTVTSSDWWFNLRPSNTEPLLRLNVEARDDATMRAVRDEVLAIVRGEAA